ncbi:quinone-dependent dihydroorotate dehydrogenase [Compostibacter hankyongensis]|uniref:Dihydroorotate dehydrogenase (quinone) n=1 Tax=Compostibacter hankyongensis TaxID=1007089 RepID=A0ABP8G9H2_9BACT
MYPLIKKLLFCLAPERVHRLVMKGLDAVHAVPPLRRLTQRIFRPAEAGLQRTVFGLTFPNPVGLAAGFDKDAKHIDTLADLGFGFIEIGTVTPLPQPGNPPPRLFRLSRDRALINRMGFNNEGVAAAATRLRKKKANILIGGNIGKNKVTPNESAVADYEKCFLALFDVVDYFVVNVSSPNTPGLRELQEKAPLTALLLRLQELNRQQPRPKPLLLKIAPDLTDAQLDDILEIVRSAGLSGIVATNTTIDRTGLKTAATEIARIGAGGLSGLPLQQRATEVVRYLHRQSGGQLPIIASGGIFTAADAREKLDAGAVLVQVYTGFIYEGPGIVKNICKGLL